ncbi:hypothetical protein ACHHYP_20244 [Achlya hypogyna]|uniref:Secreted protein n=1 Tax=Achlya hypogyna TaxID=1202772 RepID=A0A1V9YVR8_ACHHY|nr:hypothetical protein ACHHYP_20244 [Achlya hypogyna]
MRALALATIVASAAAAACPYGAVQGSRIVVADNNCAQTAAKTCIITSNCTKVDADAVILDKYNSFGEADGVGDMTNYPNTGFNLFQNSIKTVSNIDFSDLTYLWHIFQRQVVWKSDLFVCQIGTLGFNNLTCSDIKNCPISTFVVSAGTFGALDALQKWAGDATVVTGFRVTQDIATKADTCSANHGKIKQLWKGKTQYSITQC